MSDQRLDPYEAFEQWLTAWLAAHPDETRGAGDLARTEYAAWCERLGAERQAVQS